jgi:transcriptional regulator with XRE-family HTH domain
MRVIPPQSFGAKLKALRLERGLTQRQLAELADLSTINICLLERGARRPSRLDHLALRRALDVGQGAAQPSSTVSDGPISSDNPFTLRAHRVMGLAQEEARRLNHNYIGTEHLLLGLVREGQGVAARVLIGMGVRLPKVRLAVEFIIARGEGAIVNEIGLTPRAKKVITLAVEEARRLGHTYVGTEHLLVGLVQGGGIAAGVLESLEVDLRLVRSLVSSELEVL